MAANSDLCGAQLTLPYKEFYRTAFASVLKAGLFVRTLLYSELCLTEYNRLNTRLGLVASRLMYCKSTENRWNQFLISSQQEQVLGAARRDARWLPAGASTTI